MVRFYSNENFPQPVAAELRRLGHDVLTVLEAGQAEQALPDEEVLAYAGAQSRVLLTLNRRDFVRLHLGNADHAGIIVCTFDPNFLEQAHRIDVAAREAIPLTGKLIRVNRVSSAHTP